MARRGTIGALGALGVVVLGLALLASRLPPPSATAIACDGCPARVHVAVDLLSGPLATDPRRARIPAGALVERADGTLNGYAAVRYHGQVGWVAASALPPLPATASRVPWSGTVSRLAALACRPPLWLSGLLAALGLGRRRPHAARSDDPDDRADRDAGARGDGTRSMPSRRRSRRCWRRSPARFCSALGKA